MGCFGFIKCMMFAFNGIIFLAGAGILAVGIWVKVDSGSMLGFLNGIASAPSALSQLLNVGYLLIAVGAVLLLIGFLGCCGAVKESRCMLLMFFVIVLVIFLAEVAGAIVVLVFKPLVEKLIDGLGTDVVANIRKDYGENKDTTGFWNFSMTTLDCCGFYNYSDFTGSPYVKNTNMYPEKCCSNYSSFCSLTKAENSTVVGCFPRFVNLINKNSIVLIAVALGIAFIEICAMVVSMSMYCRIGSKIN